MDEIATLIVNFGSSAEAFVKVLFGELEPLGKLPFELPSSMDAVLASNSDSPNDTVDPTFPFGYGLRYENWSPIAAPEREDDEDHDVASGRWDLDHTPIGELLDDPQSNAIISSHVPELVENPMVQMARALSLNAVLDMAGSSLDPSVISDLKAEIGCALIRLASNR